MLKHNVYDMFALPGDHVSFGRRLKREFLMNASNRFVTLSQTASVLFRNVTLGAQLLRPAADLQFSVCEPKAAALQVNLPV